MEAAFLAGHTNKSLFIGWDFASVPSLKTEGED